MTVGDYNGDGVSDLAASAPGNKEPNGTSAGAINLIFGGTTGIDPLQAQIISQGTPGIAGTPEDDDRFGYVLAK